MPEDGWEHVQDRRRPWVAVPVVLVLVVIGAFLARPSTPPSSDLEVTRAPTPAPTPSPAEDTIPPRPADVAVLHALNTASLATRVEPVEITLDGRRLRSAVTTRGLQRLVVGLESVHTDEADLQVRDSSTLRIVANLGTHPGPLERLAISPEADAVTWFTPSFGGAPAALHRVEFARVRGRLTPELGPPQRRSIALPITDEAILDVQPLRRGHVGVALAAEPRGALRILVYDLTDEVEHPVTDVTVERILGDPAPALVWHDAWALLHVPHVRDDGLTTVELRTGQVHRSPPEDASSLEAGFVWRRAGLVPDSGVVLVTGELQHRFDPTGGVNPEPDRLLEPVLFHVHSGPPELRWRGDPTPGRLLAVAADRAVLTSRRPPPGSPAAGPDPDVTLHAVTVDPEHGVIATGRPIVLAGELLDVELDASRPRLTAVRALDGATVVSRHGWEVDDPPIERRFAAGATVHPSAVVVIELR
jgi:hypothetical protein